MSDEQTEVINRLKDAMDKAYQAGKQDALEGIIVVASDDLFSFLLCSLDYAVGRQSYITGIVPMQVRAYWRHLTSSQRHVIYRDFQSNIARYDRAEKKIGADFDDAEWRSLLSWMQEQLAREPA